MRIARYIAAGMLAACMAWGESYSCLTFDSNSATYLDITGIPINNDSGSVSVWFKSTGGVSSGKYIFAARNGDATATRIYIYLDSSSLRGSFGDLGNLNGGGSVVGDEMWHHALLTWDKNINVKLYLDGLLADDTAHIVFTAGGIIRIGAYAQILPDNYFNGSIESPVRIYSYALSAEQVFGLYWPDARRLNYTVATNQLASLPSPEWPLANIGGTNMLTEITLRPNPLLPAGAAATNAWTTYDGQHTITPYNGPTIGE